MKRAKYYLYLNREETGIVIQSLNRLRNAMLRENRDTNCVDALLLKVMSAPIKKISKITYCPIRKEPFILYQNGRLFSCSPFDVT